jgi:hypothetical protein
VKGIRDGRELAAARSDGRLAKLKRYGLVPKNRKEWAIIIGICLAAVEYYARRPATEKTAPAPIPQTIVNIYVNGVEQKPAVNGPRREGP